MKKITTILSLILAFSLVALADIARPDPTKTPKAAKQAKSIDTEMYIRLDADAEDARLIIPRSQIKQLRAQLDDLDNGNTAAVISSATSRLSTIFSGAFISLAIVFGGIWLVRSGKASSGVGKGAVVSLVVLGVASAASYVYANAGPPAEARSITGKMFSQAVHFYNTGWGRVKLETTTEDDKITLIVPNPPDKPNGEE
ncbi:MAG: hypothetical protein JO053_00165 [Acidobacteria bacterium]|nr:hypothetical protein [Acidobacteriota bacterium]